MSSSFDLYRRNHATRRYAGATTEMETVAAIVCPFCGLETTTIDNRIAEHVERCGFTRCPGVGVQPGVAARRAKQLTADYRLLSECAFGDE